MTPLLVIPDVPNEADHKAIEDALVAFNNATAGPAGYEEVAVLLRDPASGDTIGGLWGHIVYDWLFVALLFVPVPLRGQGLGRELLRSAEELARTKGCVGVWLDTFEFQAPLFYQRLGYQVFGELPDHPRGNTRFMLRKLL